MSTPLIIVSFALFFAAGVGMGYYIRRLVAASRMSSIEARLKKLVEDSKREAKDLLIEAKEKAAKTLDEAKNEERERQKEIRRLEERLIERETSSDRRMDEVQRKEKDTETRIEKEQSEDMTARLRKLEVAGAEELERRARAILATIIQRLATATTSEVTTTTVAIPSEDLKGKIIGREGRNIKSL